ncbi:GGDEF domain-containing protein [uncultured Marinobacter sp.]|jgi:diguanylate cyclase (GGDEF)-like protein|uniref:GGDEF domain-containing protein n=1 Tax=uncultured Marinobacter sp. TaxID=187379 RepID=UPI000C4805FA|nr:GGDEF domain-containing protein [Oceanospirillales bacterium]|tara:strand:- start:1466 stop:2428 length:963 start_codon:yes stop_codon:yes gene_type:complete
MDKRIPLQNLPNRADGPEGTVSDQGLQAVLDNLDALVYVSDLDTYELLYMNAYGRRIWGDRQGQKCWQVLQGNDGPCSFCTNSKLVGADGEPRPPYIWEFQNILDKRWYQCRDRAIRWTDGRLVRMEIATDITERKEMELALKAAHAKARAAALEDELTGLHNRRAFFELGSQMLKQARRRQAPLAILMFDLDHFKVINDTHGHEAGDAVLRRVGQLLRDRVRESDIAARIGGEEFALLLPDTDEREATELADRMLRLLRTIQVDHRHSLIQPTASFGLAMMGPGEQHLERLLSQADQAMYLSKSRGRDRLSLYPGPSAA